jgi:hypothetical protein
MIASVSGPVTQKVFEYDASYRHNGYIEANWKVVAAIPIS